MKRICLVSAIMLLMFSALLGVVQTTDGKDVLAYWSFNSNTTSNAATYPDVIPSDIGFGTITWPSSTRVHPTGSSVNLLPDYDYGNGIGYDIKDPVQLTKYLYVSCPTNYYKEIVLSYAVRQSIGAYLTHIVYYLDASNDYTEIHRYDRPHKDYYLKTIDFSSVERVNDSSDTSFKITLTGDYAVTLTCATHFDNFLITGTPMYDFIPNRPADIGGTTITFENGGADNITSTAVMPALPPNSAEDIESLALDLKGEGPWNLKLDNPKAYCAYNYGGAWVEVIKSDGCFEIEIETPSQRTGNELYVVFLDEQPTLPMELTAFKVFAHSGSFPKISWETASETALNGYYVLRGESPYLHSAQVISPLIPAQNSSLYMHYEFEDKSVVSDVRYYYWLHILELNQVDSYAGPIALEYHAEESQTPQQAYLLTGIRDIYPNPFNPSTNISFELADDAEVGFKMYNLRGEEVLRLESRPYPKGVHHISIDSKTQVGRELPAGVYLLRMQAGSKSYLRKMTLLK